MAHGGMCGQGHRAGRFRRFHETLVRFELRLLHLIDSCVELKLLYGGALTAILKVGLVLVRIKSTIDGAVLG